MIKYHDNRHGIQYGEDHQLTDNWNSAPIYKDDEYISVYFRIDTDGYSFGGSWWNWETPEQRDAFNAEMKDILKAFNIAEGVYAPEGGIEHLHIHPQNITGTVKKNNVKAIAEAIQNSATAKIRWVDLYDEIIPISDNEFIEILDEQRDKIRATILDVFKTPRRNLYITSLWDAISKITAKYTIHRPSCESGDDGTARGYVADILKGLIEEGQIRTAETKNGTGYRTAKPDELKKGA